MTGQAVSEAAWRLEAGSIYLRLSFTLSCYWKYPMITTIGGSILDEEDLARSFSLQCITYLYICNGTAAQVMNIRITMRLLNTLSEVQWLNGCV